MFSYVLEQHFLSEQYLIFAYLTYINASCRNYFQTTNDISIEVFRNMYHYSIITTSVSKRAIATNLSKLYVNCLFVLNYISFQEREKWSETTCVQYYLVCLFVLNYISFQEREKWSETTCVQYYLVCLFVLNYISFQEREKWSETTCVQYYLVCLFVLNYISFQEREKWSETTCVQYYPWQYYLCNL